MLLILDYFQENDKSVKTEEFTIFARAEIFTEISSSSLFTVATSLSKNSLIMKIVIGFLIFTCLLSVYAVSVEDQWTNFKVLDLSIIKI